MEKIRAKNQRRMMHPRPNKGRNEELEKMRKELGAIGGAGHFWGNDKWTGYGGVRNEMNEAELKKVLRLLAAGENKINLKEKGSFNLF